MIGVFEFHRNNADDNGLQMGSLKAKYNLSHEISDTELENYARIEDDRVIAKLVKKLQPCVGATTELEGLIGEGHHHLAIVSSSALRRIVASIDTVGQAKYFARHNIFSAVDSLDIPTSKPDPAVYLHALQSMGKRADECVAVEDSKSGATAACKAGIVTIGYTGAYEPEERENMRMMLMDVGCRYVMNDWAEFRQCLGVIEGGNYLTNE